MTADTATDVVTRLDVPYGEDADDRSRTLDVVARKDAEGVPVLVFAHGGGWLSGDKSQAWQPSGGLGGALVRRGIAVVSANYRLVRRRWREQAADLAAAVAWTLAHAAEFGGDPLEVHLGGHSAGAHLAALVALDPSFLAAHSLQPTELAGVICIAGLYDLGAFKDAALARYDEICSQVIQPVFGAPSDVWAEASPIAYAGRAPAPPFLLIAGDVDPLDRQIAPFEERLAVFGIDIESVIVPGADHTGIIGRPSGANPVTVRRIARFVEAARARA